MTKGKNSRRWFLSAAGALATTGLAGCLSRAETGTPTGSDPKEARSTDPTSTDTINRKNASGETYSPDDAPVASGDESITSTSACPDELFRCQGDPVSVERSFTDPPGYQLGQDDQPRVAGGIEYDPSNGAVTIATRASDGEVVETRTITFEEWARMEATSIGLTAAVERADDRGEIDVSGSSIGHPPEWADVDPPCIKLYVSRSDASDRTATTIETRLSRFAETAPGSVHVTVSLEGNATSQRTPVFAQCSRDFEVGIPSGSP